MSVYREAVKTPRGPACQKWRENTYADGRWPKCGALHKISSTRGRPPLDTGVLTTDRDKVVRPPPFRGGLTTQNLEDTLEGNFTMVAA